MTSKAARSKGVHMHVAQLDTRQNKNIRQTQERREEKKKSRETTKAHRQKSRTKTLKLTAVTESTRPFKQTNRDKRAKDEEVEGMGVGRANKQQ